MAWNEGLEGPALDFAGSRDRVVRALAGPGTGKTFALIRRVARLLEEGSEPDRILVLTFARTAARDLVAALGALGEQGYGSVRARTLHGYCFSLLMREGVLLATGRVPRILMDFEKDAALWDLSGPFGGIRNRRAMAEAFEAAWARRQSDEPGEPVVGLDQRFQDELRSWLRWHKGMLVGELVSESLAYLRHNPESPELRSYGHVLVDEYQDLNRAEQDLVDLLSASGDLVVIGDDDQSIYSFKWANPEGIRTFPAGHEGTHDVRLEECRRCPTRVVELARSLLDRDGDRPGDHQLRPYPDNPEGDVHAVQWPSIEVEGVGIATFLKSRIDDGTPAGQCLVLAPRRVIGYAIRDALTTLGVEVDTYFREEPVETPTAQMQLSLLTLLVHPHDRVSMRAWLGFDGNEMRRAPYARALEAARDANQDIATTLEQVVAGERELAYSADLASRFRNLVDERRRLTPLLGDLEALVDALFPADQPDLLLLRAIAVASLRDADGDPREFLALVRASISQPEVPIESPHARIMSFHKSKGLTAEVVVLAGLVDGLMPQAPKPTDREEDVLALVREQRRLFYVGLTRARRSLVLSWEYQLPAAMVRQNRLPHGAWSNDRYQTYASPFLRELGPTLPEPVRGRDWPY